MNDERPQVDENPYASPLAAGEAVQRFPAALWQLGDFVIAHRLATWPHLCVKTGVVSEQANRLPISTQYPNWLLLPLFGLPWIALVISLFLPKSTAGLYLGIGILAIVAVGFVATSIFLIRTAKRTTIEFFVAPNYLAQRRAKLNLANVLTAVGIVGVMVSLLLLMPLGPLRWGIFLTSIIVIATGGRYRATWLRILKPTKTQPEYIVLRGAGKAFLSQLPPWPYGPA